MARYKLNLRNSHHYKHVDTKKEVNSTFTSFSVIVTSFTRSLFSDSYFPTIVSFSCCRWGVAFV